MMCVDRKLIRERMFTSQISRWSSKAMLPDATKTQIYMNIYHIHSSFAKYDWAQ